MAYPAPRIQHLGLLVFLSVACAVSAGGLVVTCPQPQNGLSPPYTVTIKPITQWTTGSAQVKQYQVDVVVSPTYRGPYDNAICAKLECGEGVPASGSACQGTECVWNVGPACTSPYLLYPSESWVFGFYTASTAPVTICPLTYRPAVNYQCQPF
jgi:hypothetical protein